MMISSLKQAAMRIAPGEPVPPGFEGEVKPVARLQPALDKNTSAAIVGVEYIIEMIQQGNEATYRCVLCDRSYYRNYDAKEIMVHILSQAHRSTYLTQHFPAAMNEINQYDTNKSAKSVLCGVIDSICSAIEDTYGRMCPTIYESNNFLDNREKYTRKVYDEKHFDEKYGKTFVDVIDHKFIVREIQKNVQKSTSPPKSSSSSKNSKKSTKPKDSKAKPINIEDEELKLKQYRFMLDAAVRDLDKMFDKYENQPESHPKYSSEWKMFWTQRSDELRKNNVNPSKYNFSTDWTKFWLRRLKELYEDELLYQKRELKKKLNISLVTLDEPVPPYRSAEPKVPAINKAPKVVPIMDEITKIVATLRDGKPHSKPSSTVTSDFHKKQPVMQKANRDHAARDDRNVDEWNRSTNKRPANKPLDMREENDRKKFRRSPSLDRISNDLDESDYEEDLNLTFIAVLRILTAFEDYLGSLGPKVVDLLSKAVALEKVKANLADDMLMNSENSILLDTCKEKLKGQILAGIIPTQKLNGVRTAIRNVSSIVKTIDRRIKEREVAGNGNHRSSSTSSSSLSKSQGLINSNLTPDLFKKLVSTINLSDSTIKATREVLQMHSKSSDHFMHSNSSMPAMDSAYSSQRSNDNSWGYSMQQQQHQQQPPHQQQQQQQHQQDFQRFQYQNQSMGNQMDEFMSQNRSQSTAQYNNNNQFSGYSGANDSQAGNSGYNSGNNFRDSKMNTDKFQQQQQQQSSSRSSSYSFDRTSESKLNFQFNNLDYRQSDNQMQQQQQHQQPQQQQQSHQQQQPQQQQQFNTYHNQSYGFGQASQQNMPYNQNDRNVTGFESTASSSSLSMGIGGPMAQQQLNYMNNSGGGTNMNNYADYDGNYSGGYGGDGAQFTRGGRNGGNTNMGRGGGGGGVDGNYRRQW